jgi:septal ring factor EnvC (AmiA/AmiB activator)
VRLTASPLYNAAMPRFGSGKKPKKPEASGSAREEGSDSFKKDKSPEAQLAKVNAELEKVNAELAEVARKKAEIERELAESNREVEGDKENEG